ncbi:hypothetical protein, partial [Bacillus sp. JJ1764]|uniref:hypothetical protein n=1 Tax=Bacillus sp. JJ1764 TaxID=3122964 RepID=UPI002FFFF4A3
LMVSEDGATSDAVLKTIDPLPTLNTRTYSKKFSPKNTKEDFNEVIGKGVKIIYPLHKKSI